jgi:tRNA pseudouridine13 synthase
MTWPAGEPRALEEEVLAGEGRTEEDLARARLTGSRRTAQLFLDDLAITPAGEDLRFDFTLPKGAYATTVLREFMKTDVEEAADPVD